MKLHLIRHGETETSGQTYAGRCDVKLTKRGKAQAREIAVALADRPIKFVYCSPLSRASHTALPLAESLGLGPIHLPDLMEFDFGHYEGRPKKEIGLHLRKHHAYESVPGGESLSDVWQRAGRFLAHFQKEMIAIQNLEVAVVGHFWINRLIHGYGVGESFEKSCRTRSYRPETGSIRTLEIRDWTLRH